MIMEGDFDPQTNTFTMNSKGVDPAGKPYDAKLVDVHKDKDTRVFSMLKKSNETRGEYMKVMEISYVKRRDQGSQGVAVIPAARQPPCGRPQSTSWSPPHTSNGWRSVIATARFAVIEQELERCLDHPITLAVECDQVIGLRQADQRLLAGPKVLVQPGRVGRLDHGIEAALNDEGGRGGRRHKRLDLVDQLERA